MEREYTAFISYRHKPLDISVARQLHRLIEHYRVPRDLRKNSPRRLGYVFRDRDELPLSSDLSANIKSALDRSRFLIVICTPDTPQSPWVGLEIEYFLQNHRRENILAVLADGTPKQSFPKQITHIYEENGITLSRIVEPLAANVVSPRRIKRDRLVREEFLRLAAAILECPYDMLKQREKRYRQQRVSAVMAVVAVIAVCFAGILTRKNLQIQEKNEEIQAQNEEIIKNSQEIQQKNDEIRIQNDEIERQNEEIQAQLEQSLKNESYALSLVSAQLLEEGDRFGAVETALSALPSAAQERPKSAEAELALCSALYAYQDEEIRIDCRLEQETEIEKMVVNHNAGYVVTLDNYNYLRCFDGYTRELLWKKEVCNCIPDCLAILESEQAVFYSYNNEENLLLSLRDSEELKKWELWDNLSPEEDIRDVSIADAQNSAAVCSSNSSGKNYIHFYQTPDFEWISVAELPEGLGRFIQSCFSMDGTRYAVAFKLKQGEEYLCTICVFDVDTGSLLYRKSVNPYKFFSSDIGLTFLPDNDLMVMQNDVYPNKQYLYRLDKDTGRTVYTQKFSEKYGSIYDQKILLNETMLICIKGEDVLIFELGTGKLLKRQKFPSYCEDCFWLDDTHEIYVAILRNGKVVSETLPNYDANQPHEERINFSTDSELSGACGDSTGTDYVCVIPKEDRCHTFIYRNQRDKLLRELEVPSLTKFDKACTHPTGDIFLSPSGDRALYIVSDSDREPEINHIVLYDTASMKELGRYEVVQSTYRDFKGFSRDETKLIFSNFTLDLGEGAVTAFSDLRDLHAIWISFQEPYIQEAGTPTIAVYFRDKDFDGFGELYWWEDGENRRGSVCPYESDHICDDQEIAIGESGLTGIAIQDDYRAERTKGYVVYSREQDVWTYLPNLCKKDGFPIFCAGNKNPWLAFADYDGFLRIINAQTGDSVRTFPLETAASAVSEMQFLFDDTVLLMVQNYNRLCILDTDDGTVKALIPLEGFGEYSRLTVQEDTVNNNLYIGERSGDIEGVCIDLSTWEVRAKISGLAGFSSKSGQIIKYDERLDNYVSYPAYTLEELIRKGEVLLGK